MTDKVSLLLVIDADNSFVLAGPSMFMADVRALEQNREGKC